VLAIRVVGTRLRAVVPAAVFCLCIFSSSLASAKTTELYRRGYVNLEIECVLGGEDAPEDEVFYRVGGFDVAPDGAVFVSEYKLNCVKKFDSSCALQFTVGQEGGGPGDLRRPRALVVEPSGDIVVFDSGNRRIERLEDDGTYISSATFQDLVEEFRLGPARELYAKVMEVPMGPPTSPYLFKLVRFDQDLKTAAKIDEMRVQLTVAAGSADRYTVTSTPYPPSLGWDVLPDGRLVVGHSDTDLFRILSPTGETLREIHTDRDPPPVTDQDKADYFGRWVRDGKDTLDPALRKVIEFRSHRPYYADIAVDTEGNILLRWDVPIEGQAVYDVYDGTGEFISRVRMGDLPENVRFLGDVIYALDSSPEKLPTIARYRMK
jgi:hypothetical protein